MPDSKSTDHPLGIWWRRWAGAIALVLLIAVGAGGFLKIESQNDKIQEQQKENRHLTLEVKQLTIEVKESQEALTAGLVKNCETGGNKIREVLQTRIENEIDQSQNMDLLEKLFPNLSKPELKELTSSSIKEREAEKKEIAPVNCKDQYPK